MQINTNNQFAPLTQKLAGGTSGAFVPSSAGGVVATGLPCAKKRILMAIDSPKCSASTRTNRTLLVCLSVALKTGYKFRRRNATDRPKPTATKTQFRMLIWLQLMRATGIQMRFE